MTPKSYPKRAIFRYLYLDVPAAREAWSKRDRARGRDTVQIFLHWTILSVGTVRGR